MIRGTDYQNIEIDVNDDNDQPIDCSVYDKIELHLLDIFNDVEAKYIYPFSSQDGYRELRLSDDHFSVLFDIFSADSENFRIGQLNAQIIFTSNDLEDYPDGYVQIEPIGNITTISN